MRYLLLVALLLAAGCSGIADYTEIRAPQTDAEWREFNEHKLRVDRVWGRVATTNRDLCGKNCTPHITIGPAPGVVAVSGTDGRQEHIRMSFPMLRLLDDDDRLAALMAHEWSHILLRHRRADGPRIGELLMETQADCVGVMLATRAGYRSDAMRANLVRSTFGTFLGWQTNAPGRLAGAGRAATAAQGRTITRETIRQICGVAP